ncbi:MAG TPA: hypothetical protein ENN23_03260 [Deltaproteobacteria bacterium]|nr:hypothetical protein [Deltaproteobacteria bacterium]
MNLIEEIHLDNRLILYVFDLSHPISEDTAKVEILVKTETKLKADYFISPEDFRQVKNIFGDKICYEYKKERSFISIENQDIIRDELIETFKSNSLRYISSPSFPKNLALSKLREIKNNPYKYLKREPAT